MARLAALAALAAGLSSGCSRRPPSIEGTVLLGYSKAAGNLWRLSLPEGRAKPLLPLPSPCGDLARGPKGEIYLARGREVLQMSPEGELLRLFGVEARVDTVLPSRDGKRLYILEHPPPKSGPPPGSGERGAEAAFAREPPHRLRLWDLPGARFSGEAELDPLAYEIFEGPGLLLTTHLRGLRVEVVPLVGGGFGPGGAEEIELSDPGGGIQNRQALLRAAAVEPEGRWALLVENGLGGEFDRARLWTLELSERRWRSHPLAARGLFQGGIVFLSPAGDGTARAVLNGCDRLLLVGGDPKRGFHEDGAFNLPGLFHDLRRVAPAPGVGPGATPKAEILLLAGTDRARSRGFLALVDPGAGKLSWLFELASPVDVLEIETP
jgi:hypothetical protein